MDQGWRGPVHIGANGEQTDFQTADFILGPDRHNSAGAELIEALRGIALIVGAAPDRLQVRVAGAFHSGKAKFFRQAGCAPHAHSPLGAVDAAVDAEDVVVGGISNRAIHCHH